MPAYATVANIAERHGDRILKIVGDRDRDGILDAAAITLALESASSECDTYLSTRYAVPIVNPPAMLIQACVDIAVYRLAYNDAALTEEMRLRYDDAIKWLKEVARGNAQIIGAAGNEPGEDTDEGLNEVTGGKRAGFFPARSALRPLPFGGNRLIVAGKMSDWRRRMQR